MPFGFVPKVPQTGVTRDAAKPAAIKQSKTGSLQDVIRSLPDCIGGKSLADFLSSIAMEIRKSAYMIAASGPLIDFGEGTTIYSTDRIVKSADDLEAYGKKLADAGGTYCRASKERNEVIRRLGECYGLIGARVEVNVVLSEAQREFVEDLGNRAKKAAEVGGEGIVVALALAIVVLVVFK